MTVSYEDMHEELADADALHSRLAYVQGLPKLSWRGKPALVLLTERGLYIGGVKATGFGFHHLPLSDVESVEAALEDDAPSLALHLVRVEERLTIRMRLSRPSLEVNDDPAETREFVREVRRLAHIR